MDAPAAVERPNPGRLTTVTRRPRESAGTIAANDPGSVSSEWSSTRSGPVPDCSTSNCAPPARTISMPSSRGAGRHAARSVAQLVPGVPGRRGGVPSRIEKKKLIFFSAWRREELGPAGGAGSWHYALQPAPGGSNLGGAGFHRTTYACAGARRVLMHSQVLG